MNAIAYIKLIKKNVYNFVTMQMIVPVVVQPSLVLLISNVLPDSVVLVSLILAGSLAMSIRLSQSELKSNFLYYWTIVSISYIIIVFEFIIVPLAEILPIENFFLVLFTLLSLFFLYLTTTNTRKVLYDTGLGNGSNGDLLLGRADSVPICPACRVKMDLDNYHCNICQECVAKYDHHSYWLNCCIGDYNIHLYFSGIFFGVFALAYGSLLILTTICSPDFHFGILVPEDCTYVCSNIETCACLVSGIYCMELAFVLAFKIVYHFWLISRGISMFESKEKLRHHSGKSSSFGRDFSDNWIEFFRKFRKIHIEL